MGFLCISFQNDLSKFLHLVLVGLVVYAVLRLFHISQCCFFTLIVSLYIFSFKKYSVLKSVLFGSLCFRFDNFLSCFLNVLQSESNHFSSFRVFFVYFLPFFFNSIFCAALLNMLLISFVAELRL